MFFFYPGKVRTKSGLLIFEKVKSRLLDFKNLQTFWFEKVQNHENPGAKMLSALKEFLSYFENLKVEEGNHTITYVYGIMEFYTSRF